MMTCLSLFDPQERRVCSNFGQKGADKAETLCGRADHWGLEGDVAKVVVGELCRRNSISSATLYKWKVKHGGLEVSVAKKPKTLETENAKLKRLAADLSLGQLLLQDILSNNW